MKFRPDVDGLRGVAVLLVVAYHAKLGVVPAGYIGVDVFLVISGFVITGMLLELIERGRFSAKTFLARRLRRLMPAAVVVVAVTLLAGWFILGPRDLRRLAGSSIAVFALAANFFFWGRQGYFADQSPEQPLLHAWSLGLEEQFYLLYPPVLLLSAALAPRARIATCALAALALFAFGVWLTGAHAGAAFYLLPARSWEFLAGALLALLAGRGVWSPAWLRSAAGLGGLGGIVLAAVALTATTPYPGVAALLPVAGSVAVIWANGAGQTLSGRLLGAKWLLALGTVSYSLYLWHWPTLTLARYYAGRDLHPLETLGALTAVAFLTYASWRGVERQFRLGADPAAPRRPLTVIVALGAVAVAASVILVRGDGFPSRLSVTALTFDSASLPDADSNRCHKGPPAPGTLCTYAPAQSAHAHLLVWGDSHANALVPALTELGRAHAVTVTQASYSGCPPLLSVRVAHLPARYCLEFNARVLQSIAPLGVSRVLLAAYWTAYLPARPQAPLARLLDPYRRADSLGGGDAAQNTRNLAEALRRTVQALNALGVEVWILHQVPTQNMLVPWALSRAATRGQDFAHLGVTLTEYRRSQSQVDRLLDDLGDSVRTLDPAARLCASGVCLMSLGAQALYIDANHLSQSGARLIEPTLEPLFH